MFMKKAHRFAVENRALWVWAIWWHSYLQSKNLAFESIDAQNLNKEIFWFIKEKTYKASWELATKLWEPKIYFL